MNQSVFNQGRAKILKCFYKNRRNPLYFREITRETGLTQTTTLAHLKALQEQRILTRIKKKAHTYYQINGKNPQVYALFSYLDYQHLNELPFERRSAIQEYLNQLKTKPLIALIFGSTAKKTFTSESDIDLLLVFNQKETRQEKLKNDIEATTGIHVQSFPIHYDYFKTQLLKQEDAVITHAIKTGFVVIGHHYFYEEVLKE